VAAIVGATAAFRPAPASAVWCGDLVCINRWGNREPCYWIYNGCACLAFFPQSGCFPR